MDRSPGFGSIMYNSFALLRLGFPSTPSLNDLILLYTITRWPVLQKVRDRTLNVLSLLVNIGFQILFHSPFGVLFTFPSRYLSSIGHQVVFSLRGWAPYIPTGFHVSHGTHEDGSLHSDFDYEALTLFGLPSQVIRLSSLLLTIGLFPFRSPLL